MRSAVRRPAMIRFRFDAGGQEHRAVATNVSPSGAFLKASEVPAKGTHVTLREFIRGNRMGVRVRGEVVWTIPRASLETPETGYAIQFIEAFSVGDPGPLEEFIRMVAPGVSPEIGSEDRNGQQCSVYRFPSPQTEPPTVERISGDAFDVLPEVDLASELDRLEREQRRKKNGRAERAARPAAQRGGDPDAESGDALSYYTRGRPRVKMPKDAEERDQDRRTTSPEAQVEPEAAPSEGIEPRPRAAARPERGRGKKRGFGGLLGLFGFGKGEQEQGEEQDEPGFTTDDESQFSPTFEASAEEDAYYEGQDSWYVGDEDPADVLVNWKDSECNGRIDKISSTMIAVSTDGAAPLHYERVTITPAFPSFRTPKVVMHGTVTRIRERHGQGGQTFIVRFSKIDERGGPGSFVEYLRYFGV